MIIKLGIACIGILLSSLCVGLNFIKEKFNIVEAVLYGFLGVLGGLEVISLPCIYLRQSFSSFFLIGLIAVVVASVIGVFRKRKYLLTWIKESVRGIPKNIYFFIFLVFLLGQVGILQLTYHMDEDDAFYVATSTTSIDTDTLYIYDAFTGEAYDTYPARYVLSPFPLYTAFVAKCFGLRPMVVAHTVFAAVMIILAYGAIWLFSELFFEDGEKKSIVMVIASGLTVFSYYSADIAGARLLLRPWQGKTLLASIVLPVILYFVLKCGKKASMSLLEFCLLFLMMLGACFVSSMGIVLSVVMLGVILVVLFLQTKNIKMLLQGIACCIPGAALSLIYLMIR
ncbi:MAG: hypothetical protein K5675_07175 [Lachnospiraceae bacterium]|nr:hypothetical protein [Lachnospiraceae bacterium]